MNGWFSADSDHTWKSYCQSKQKMREKFTSKLHLKLLSYIKHAALAVPKGAVKCRVWVSTTVGAQQFSEDLKTLFFCFFLLHPIFCALMANKIKNGVADTFADPQLQWCFVMQLSTLVCMLHLWGHSNGLADRMRWHAGWGLKTSTDVTLQWQLQQTISFSR